MLYSCESSSHPFGQGSQLNNESRVCTEVSAAVVSQAHWTVTGLLCLCRNVYYVACKPMFPYVVDSSNLALLRTATKLH